MGGSRREELRIQDGAGQGRSAKGAGARGLGFCSSQRMLTSSQWKRQFGKDSLLETLLTRWVRDTQQLDVTTNSQRLYQLSRDDILPHFQRNKQMPAEDPIP